jgi:hypothetical protein
MPYRHLHERLDPLLVIVCSRKGIQHKNSLPTTHKSVQEQVIYSQERFGETLQLCADRAKPAISRAIISPGNMVSGESLTICGIRPGASHPHSIGGRTPSNKVGCTRPCPVENFQHAPQSSGKVEDRRTDWWLSCEGVVDNTSRKQLLSS